MVVVKVGLDYCSFPCQDDEEFQILYMNLCLLNNLNGDPNHCLTVLTQFYMIIRRSHQIAQ
jgi:hypothetical protein